MDNCKKIVSLIAILLLIIGKTSLAQTTNAPTIATKVTSTSVTPYHPDAYSENIPINYVRTWQPRLPYTSEADVLSGVRTVNQVNSAIQYIDGLGRSMQTVGWQTSPNKKDMVAPVIYDSLGRQQYEFLPYADTSSNGLFKQDPFGAQSNFYTTLYPNQQPAFTNEKIFYSKINFEQSPLNRVTKNFAPGNSWAGSEGSTVEHAIQMKYLVNTVYDSVRIWNIANQSITCTDSDTAMNIPTTTAYYEPGQLYKNVTIDEKGNTIVQYTDKQGSTILKKVQVGDTANVAYTNWLCTYYIYDNFGLLRVVLPPKSVRWLVDNGWNVSAFFSSATNAAQEGSYRYEYDSRNRMIAKKVPGAGWAYMIYDKRDRLVFTQDANMRTNDQWAYGLNDDLNRPVEAGIITDDITFCDLQAYVNDNTGNSISGIVTTYGTMTSGIPLDLEVSSRQLGIPLYQGKNSITVNDGFETEDNADVVFQIAAGDSSTFYSTLIISDNPIPTGIAKTALTLVYYDDYSQTSRSYDNRNNSKLDIGTNDYGETLPVHSTAKTIGMSTISRIRVIEDPTDLTEGKWMETAIFYDDKGRPIQTNSDNYKGGQDISTSRYDFTNKIISNYLIHNNPEASVSDLRIKTNINYDHVGRVLNVSKEINDDVATKRVITRNTYDALGQLLSHELGQKNAVDTTAMENQTFNYNIRGWLKGINWDYSDSTNGSKPFPSPLITQGGTWFAMDLSYDWGFDSSQFNGSIAGQRWRSAGDGEERSYGYGYDAVNRLMYSDFNQKFGSGWSKNNGDLNIDFSAKMGDGINTATAYDENGNIKFMQQKELLLNTSSVIDSLSYTYYPNSNKLKNVIDGTNNTSTTLGDFRSSQTYMDLLGTKTSTATDYDYDANGNLKKDMNKDIGDASTDGIEYNYLNQPSRITVKNKGTIVYIYDAAGKKLEKRTTEATISKTTITTYIGGFVYQNDSLQFFGQEEGRIRKKDSVYVYDYFIRDHLGNIRTVLTEEHQQDIYPAATLESGSMAVDTLYYNIHAANIVDTSAIPGFNDNSNEYDNNNGIPNPDPNISASAGSQKMYKLNGGSGDKTGLGFTLKVIAGDTIDIFGKSYFIAQDNSADNSSNDLVPLTILSGLLAAPGNALQGTKVAVTATQLNGITGINNAVSDFLTTEPYRIPQALTTPRAYINYIILDEHFQYVSGGISAVGSSGTVKDHHSDLSGIVIPKNGYVYVYCSNESPIDVFFDNLQVVDGHGPLVQENNYSPFGLQLKSISSQCVNFGEAYTQRRKFNAGTEFAEDLGINLYETPLRAYDPQLGRFTGIDIFSEQTASLTPYQFGADNPTMFNDPSGANVQQNVERLFKQMAYKADGGDIGVTAKQAGENLEKERKDRNSQLAQDIVNRTNDVYNSQYGGKVSVKNGKVSVMKSTSVADNLFSYSKTPQGFYYENSSGSGVFVDQKDRGLETTNADANDGPYHFIGHVGPKGLVNGKSEQEESKSGIDIGLEWAGRANDLIEAGGKVSMTSTGVAIGRITGPASFAIGAAQIGRGYSRDGNRFGYNTKKATSGFLGSLAGAWAGFEAGAAVGFEGGFAIGAAFGGIGAIPGAVIGGILGGFVGAFGGAYYGGKLGESLITH